jgi:hypothetical protein
MMLLVGYLLALLLCLATAFLPPQTSIGKKCFVSKLKVVQDIGRPPTFLDNEDEGGDDDDVDVSITFLDESEVEEEGEDQQPKGQGRERWENLNPKIKQRLVEKGEAKAVANKKKREPADDKKRRK